MRKRLGFVGKFVEKAEPPGKDSLQVFEKLAGTTGLEPATSAVTGQRSNQLNYVPARR